VCSRIDDGGGVGTGRKRYEAQLRLFREISRKTGGRQAVDKIRSVQDPNCKPAQACVGCVILVVEPRTHTSFPTALLAGRSSYTNLHVYGGVHRIVLSLRLRVGATDDRLGNTGGMT